MADEKFETYLDKLKSSWDENKLQVMQSQRQLLAALRSRHQIWARDADTPAVKLVHIKSAQLLQELLNSYDQALERASQNNS